MLLQSFLHFLIVFIRLSNNINIQFASTPNLKTFELISLIKQKLYLVLLKQISNQQQNTTVVNNPPNINASSQTITLTREISDTFGNDHTVVMLNTFLVKFYILSLLKLITHSTCTMRTRDVAGFRCIMFFNFVLS